MDGVIADLLSLWLKKYNKEFDDDLKPEQITLWNWHPLSKDSEGKKIYTYLDDRELFLNLPVINGSQEVLSAYKDKFNFYIVTACFNPENILPKWRWLEKNFPFLDKDKFMFVRDKGAFNGDILIDDKPANLEKFRGSGILFSAPHNLTETKFLRVNNWDDVAELFEQLLFWRTYDERSNNGTYPRPSFNLLH